MRGNWGTLPARLQGEVAAWLVMREVAHLCATSRTVHAALAGLDGLWRRRLDEQWLPEPCSATAVSPSPLAELLGREARAVRWRQNAAERYRTNFKRCRGTQARCIMAHANVLLVGGDNGEVTVFELPALTQAACWPVVPTLGSPLHAYLPAANWRVARLWVHESGALLALAAQSLRLWQAGAALRTPRTHLPVFRCRWNVSSVDEAVVRDDTDTVLALSYEHRVVREWRASDGGPLREIYLSSFFPRRRVLTEWNGHCFALHDAYLEKSAQLVASETVRGSGSGRSWRCLSLDVFADVMSAYWRSPTSGCSLGALARRRSAPLGADDLRALYTELLASTGSGHRIFDVSITSRYLTILFWNEEICVADFGPATSVDARIAH